MPSRHALESAYLSTHYHVFTDPPCVLTIDHYSRTLAGLYARYGIDHCAYLTACNPHSRMLDTPANAAREAALKRILQRRGFKVIDGSGRDPNGRWPAEASVLVMGLSCRDACRLAARFGQNAIVFCGPSAKPELIWLVPKPSSAD